RQVTDRSDILARGAEVGADLENGGGVIYARAHPHMAQEGDWRSRVMTVALRVLRTQAHGTLAVMEEGDLAGIKAVVPASEAQVLTRAAQALARELTEALPGFRVTVAYSRWASDPTDLYRAGREALLAA